MPSLHGVCAWEIPFPPAGTEVDILNSPNIFFTTDCSETDLMPDKINDNVNIFPNPAVEQLNIEIENPDNAMIEIYNAIGNRIFSKAIHSQTEKIDLSDFSTGFYLVKVKHGGTVMVGKVEVK